MAEAGRVNELSHQTVLITMKKYISFNIRNVRHARSLNHIIPHKFSHVYSAMILKREVSFNIRNVRHARSLNHIISHKFSHVYSAMILKREVCNQTISSCCKHNLLRCTCHAYQTFPAYSPLLLLKRKAGGLAIGSER